MSAPVAVTGIGVAAPTGLGVAAHWAATMQGRSAIGPVRRFDAEGYASRLAGEVPGFDAAEHLPGRLLPQTDHMTRLALVAAQEAITDAGLDDGTVGEYEMGVVTASSSGGFEFGQDELRALWSKGSEFVSAYQSFAWFYAVNTGQISIRHGLRGPSSVLVSDQAGGLDALAHARRQLGGDVRYMVSGGMDAGICPWGWVAQQASGRLSETDDAGRAYLPFDAAASGHVVAEGGALLIVEDAEQARRRRPNGIYGEILGHASTLDPRPGSDRPPGLRRAIELALRQAGTSPDDVDVVFADGAAVPELDRTESDVLAAVFGERGVPVTVPKTMTGRLCSGAGALDVVTALLAIRHGVIPPTVNTEPDAAHRLDLVTGDPRPAPLRVALVLARGVGGFNAAVVLRGEPAADDRMHDTRGRNEN